MLQLPSAASDSGNSRSCSSAACWMSDRVRQASRKTSIMRDFDLVEQLLGQLLRLFLVGTQVEQGEHEIGADQQRLAQRHDARQFGLVAPGTYGPFGEVDEDHHRRPLQRV